MGASWQAFYAHLCAASIIRAMPETEIPPAMRGDLYCVLSHSYGSISDQKLSPLAGDSSQARPVGDAARGESGGIGSIASGSEARRPYSNQRCGFRVSESRRG